jgi:hypothetical protein
LQDYEDFARAFSGVAKALATLSWGSRGRHVLVTVAGTKGAEIAESSDVYLNLLAAMNAAGDPNIPLRVKSFTHAFFTVSGKVFSAPEYLEAKVQTGVEDALRRVFSFEARSFGQSVARSEVITVIQSISGVVSVDLDSFYRVGDSPSLETELTASPPHSGTDDDLGAELLIIDARPLELAMIKVTSPAP